MAVNGWVDVPVDILRWLLQARYLASDADKGSQFMTIGITSVEGLGVAVPELLAIDQRVKDYYTGQPCVVKRRWQSTFSMF